MAAYTTIDDPEAHYQTQLYTGNGAANHAITLGADTDMQPDLVWIKNRDQADAHCLFDAVRGATEVIHPNANSTEATDADTLDSFTSDGFQVDADVKVNTNTEDYVAWCWKGANGTASNTSGSLTTTVSANTAAGFSIVTYTLGSGTGSSTQGHGLGAKPDVIIWKSLANAYDWRSYWNTPSMLAGNSIIFSDTNALYDNVRPWNDTEPTSTLFTHGNNSWNGAGEGVAYCWTSIQGYSKIGEYTGNASTDGPFIYTGFRPAFVLIKRSSDGANQWSLSDNKRGVNGAIGTLTHDSTEQEYTPADQIDHLSNGFKIRQSAAARNATGATYIYMAFAEAPFVNSNGVPCNAR